MSSQVQKWGDPVLHFFCILERDVYVKVLYNRGSL